MNRLSLQILRDHFGERLLANELLSRHTSARVGGPATAVLVAAKASELAEMVAFMWLHEQPAVILGGGSNVLVSDAGIDGVVILNRAKQISFDPTGDPASVWAESGANFGSLARQACQRGLSGLEWAVGVPGTVGGAVVGNAGAHGGDVAGNLMVAEILHRKRVVESSLEPYTMRETWSLERMEYAYRNSAVKRQPGQFAVLSARLWLASSTPEAVITKADEYTAYRHRTQPPGATMGSMFKNPPGDYAGRLIEAAGMKGVAVGEAEISPLHANFFINHGQASASDIYRLIELARAKVQERFGILLELEVELLGNWQMERALE
jgi:UDP-N-acetylmuramate dehydrogenase